MSYFIFHGFVGIRFSDGFFSVYCTINIFIYLSSLFGEFVFFLNFYQAFVSVTVQRMTQHWLLLRHSPRASDDIDVGMLTHCTIRLMLLWVCVTLLLLRYLLLRRSLRNSRLRRRGLQCL